MVHTKFDHYHSMPQQLSTIQEYSSPAYYIFETGNHLLRMKKCIYINYMIYSRSSGTLVLWVLLKWTRNSILPSAPFRGDSIHPLQQKPNFSTPFIIFSRTCIAEINHFHFVLVTSQCCIKIIQQQINTATNIRNCLVVFILLFT